ncbi:MAG: class I SAM-dependent methyltransferase [Spirochaetaceae bacterium]|jgi:SAM-dependent methyltransferase|nr:class I SAM-dependent methyltransferase [Spirochaetaceae bacterium]
MLYYDDMENPGPYKAEWWNDAEFWERYAPIMFDNKRWTEVPEVADGITRLARLGLYGGEEPASGGMANGTSDGMADGTDGETGGGRPCLQSPPRILDLCCGFGRITLELARRGFSATGVDVTRAYLETARADAAYENLDVEFVHADGRLFSRHEEFDAAVNCYISFGYFENSDDDRLMARNVWDSLKPGGAFIIETLGKEIAVRDFTQGEWFERAGYTVLTEYAPVDSWTRLWNRWILIREGNRIEKTFTQRLYAASELRQLLLEAGFSRVELYGGWDESPYDYRAEKLIAVGRKGLSP